MNAVFKTAVEKVQTMFANFYSKSEKNELFFRVAKSSNGLVKSRFTNPVKKFARGLEVFH